MVEVFAGIGSLSKCLQIAGYNTAALDITYWSPWVEKRKQKRLRKTCKGNPLNLLSPAGFAFLGGKFWDWIFNIWCDVVLKSFLNWCWTSCMFGPLWQTKSSYFSNTPVQRWSGGYLWIGMFYIYFNFKRINISIVFPSRRGSICQECECLKHFGGEDGAGCGRGLLVMHLFLQLQSLNGGYHKPE